MTYAQNVRAILECCFSQSKEEIITTATNAILALKSEPVVVDPITTPTYPTYPYYTINTGREKFDITPHITCTGTAEDLKNSQNSDIVNREN